MKRKLTIKDNLIVFSSKYYFNWFKKININGINMIIGFDSNSTFYYFSKKKMIKESSKINDFCVKKVKRNFLESKIFYIEFIDIKNNKEIENTKYDLFYELKSENIKKYFHNLVGIEFIFDNCDFSYVSFEHVKNYNNQIITDLFRRASNTGFITLHKMKIIIENFVKLNLLTEHDKELIFFSMDNYRK